MSTLDIQDGLAPAPASDQALPARASTSPLERRYLAGCVAGLLLGSALAVPLAYALLRSSGGAPTRSLVERSDMLDLLVSSGLEALTRKEPSQALGLFQLAARAYPENAKVHNNVCVALNELGRYDEALVACDRAVALDPTFTLAANNQAWARAQLAKTTAGSR